MHTLVATERSLCNAFKEVPRKRDVDEISTTLSIAPQVDFGLVPVETRLQIFEVGWNRLVLPRSATGSPLLPLQSLSTAPGLSAQCFSRYRAVRSGQHQLRCSTAQTGRRQGCVALRVSE